MINPIKPISPKPIAETLAIVLNSVIEGFLRTLHTLLHCDKKDFILNIKVKTEEGF